MVGQLRHKRAVSCGPRRNLWVRGNRESLAIEETGIPYVLFHLAIYPEIKAAREFIMNYTEAALANSLRQLTSRDIHETTKYIRMPVENPDRMIKSETDYHPSRWGNELYADAVAEMLIRNGYVKAGPRILMRK